MTLLEARCDRAVTIPTSDGEIHGIKRRGGCTWWVMVEIEGKRYPMIAEAECMTQ